MSYKKNNFEIRNICGEHALIAHGIEHVDFGKMIALNETATFIWEHLPEEPFDAEAIAKRLILEYKEVDFETVLSDVQNLFQQWEEIGVISKC